MDGYTRILAGAAASGRRLTRDELRSRRELGEQAAEAGHSLRALVVRHLAATREAWPPTADGSLLHAVEQAIDAFAEGYERAQRLAVRQEEAARREFIDDLLSGRSDLGRLAARSERFGLRLSGSHAVAVAGDPAAYDETGFVLRRVEQDVFARFGDRHILITTKDGRLVCIAPGNQDEILSFFAARAHAATKGSQVAVGRSHAGPGGVVHSYEEALNALDLAERIHLHTPVLRARDLLVFPVLTRDRAAMTDLVHTVLSPLQAARSGPGPLLDTLSAYFDAGCVAAEAARQLGLSVRALTYRLARIHRLTGSDPTDPIHRYTLQTAVIGARLLDWPGSDLQRGGT
ncbi:helix-turn-helix domain-containing protein [Streptomyces sp. MTZ3.1]|uniref:Helix-turn-helix domain-containing protein n=2 Tax=Streptomyces meridianus TaxID=2938945 RepID=A0ABT0X7W3_9ACTN|nr:helix-turn-helix domain-containing protein [Streptomyces meridianus]MCM2577802.1 helix-turn-helix domain-containing protein [Streptomyces meridianus]